MNAYVSRTEDQSKLSFNTKETNLDKVLKFFVSGNIAFNQADNPYFQELMQTMQQNVKGPVINRKSIRTRLGQLAIEAKEDLMIMLMENDSKVSLALDCWGSRNGYGFLGKILYHTFR